MKQPYILAAMFAAKTQEGNPIESLTPIETHRSTHAAGIPEFHLSQSQIIVLQIHFKADPDKFDSAFPDQKAQAAALKQLNQEIKAHYPVHTQPKYKLEPDTP